jgi:L-lysine cyclodeaminase
MLTVRATTVPYTRNRQSEESYNRNKWVDFSLGRDYMETLLLCQDDLERMLELIGRDALMRRMIDKLTEGLTELGRGTQENSPARTGFTRSSSDIPGVIELMPHRDPGSSVTIKMISYSPANAQKFRLPTILGTIARINDNSGRLTAIADAVLLTAVRTGAASAVASRLLATPESSTVGLIGAGSQAVTQLHGLSQFFDIESVLVYDIDGAAAASFAERVAFLNVSVKTAWPERILAESDIICTATSVPVGGGPVLPDGDHPEHLHINSIGSDEIGKTELPKSLLQRAFVCVDHRTQAEREGESQQLQPEQIGPSLAHLLAHPNKAVVQQPRLTVFDSTGFALEDHLALDVFLTAAEELGLGTKLPIERHPNNLLDPYSLYTTRP